MKVQIQLRKLLQDRGLDRRGIIQKISASTKLDRRVIAKYYNDEAPTVSLTRLDFHQLDCSVVGGSPHLRSRCGCLPGKP